LCVELAQRSTHCPKSQSLIGLDSNKNLHQPSQAAINVKKK